jgi:hypothetical protein
MIEQEFKMDLRDYFAVQVIPLAFKHYKEWLKLDCDDEYMSWNGKGKNSEVNMEMIAQKCYSFANAMMKIRIDEDMND